MSASSRQSHNPNRHLHESARGTLERRRTMTKSHDYVVDHEDARSFALRAAYLHYLLQPKAKRKQWVSNPTPARSQHARSHSSVAQIVQEYASGTTASLKLPHNFSQALLDRISGVLRGAEPLPGYNDAAVKRSFAEAYTTFSEKSFRKNIDKDRKFEPLVLMFYTAATKATRAGLAPGDESWKFLPDRHLAMFVRLTTNILRDTGQERDKPELASRLHTLEKKLLTNDQNLVDNDSNMGKQIEVTVPLSYDVKDMPLVQVVAHIFGLNLSDVQSELNGKRSVWTEEAAVKDLKLYLDRLHSDMPGALSSSDFDVDEAFEEWKQSEKPLITNMMGDILIDNPQLAKTSTGDKPLPSRPSSVYGEDGSLGDLSRAISASADGSGGFDPGSLARMSLGGTSSIRAVDDNIYTYIPAEPRSFYKYILQHAMTYDQIHADPETDYQPLSKQSYDLMTELCVRWRLPQASRQIAMLEVAARKYNDEELNTDELDDVFNYIKKPAPDAKKARYMHQSSTPLSEIPPSRWTLHDFAMYQNTLHRLHDSLLRELFDLMEQCYNSKPPQTQAVLWLLETHIEGDHCFTQRPDAVLDFSRSLEERLSDRAIGVYRESMEKILLPDSQDWDFLQVVKLGKSVTNLCDRIRKRYKKNPVIMGVNPLTILVQRILPSFEGDAQHIIKVILGKAQDEGLEFDIQEGFELYRELKAIRSIHEESLPAERPFAFNIEKLLVEFPTRLVRNSEARMEEYVDSAVKQDQFQVRVESPNDIPTDEQRHSVSVIDLFMLFKQTVEQIQKLDWGNPEHHARFMTSLAKSFSVGLGKYCETVESQFAREMDRPSAEEAAMQNRSTQEKWMAYAKNAWNNQDKPAPFQFYPESFVKLNNIEYAMQELDKLEKGMNAEGCAALLEKIDGPKKKTMRRLNKYTFTVKVLEAEDLKACDPSGLSDPYVVFGDEYQKRLHKTRIIYRNLNPRWDESFDITVQGPVNVIATVWDYDTFGDHDYVGRTSLKLDPVHFKDYLPREFWLDLDSQGRMLVRISMEGERDDIQFHFGKAFRHLKRTERDMVRKVTDKLTSHINATLSHDALRSLLGTGGIGASVSNLWKKRTSTMPTAGTAAAQTEAYLEPLFAYFNDNFAIMKQTLTDATMLAVMTRLWKEVLMTIENLLVPPASEKPSTQRPLTRRELDVVYHWLDMLFNFFNARDEESGEILGVPAEVLKSPKWHELASLNFFYFDDTGSLMRESERMAAATAQRAQQALLQRGPTAANPTAAPASLGASLGGAGAFASMGTIRRGKSVMMSRNLGTMRKAKEIKRREAQADPSDDMILRILRMRPEAAGYLKERHRQKDRQAATAAAALIMKNSVNQGWSSGGQQLGKNNLPRR